MNVPLLLTGQVWHSYDFPTHLFFASHYQRSWWTLWEPRWFGGFDVASYPPLAHQLIALLGWVIGTASADGVLTGVAVVGYPVAVFGLARRYLGLGSARRAAALAVVTPSVLLAAYTFGQLPTLLGLDAGLFTALALGSYLERGGAPRLAVVAALAGTTVAAHHATFIFFGPPLLGIVALAELSRSAERRRLLGRGALVVLVLAIVVVGVIFPFWVWHATEYVRQTPIDHPSRHDLLADVAAQKVFFWGEHGVLAVTLVIALPLLGRQPGRILPWYALSLFLLMLGLGGTTPLPRLLFGEDWAWLTYDRFSLWSDVGLALLLGAVAEDLLRQRSSTRWLTAGAWWLTLGCLGGFGLVGALRPTLVAAGPAPIDPRPIVAFLGSEGRDHWRYLTFGFGEQAGLLNAATDATTIDGYYFTARRLPLLTASGVGQIDFSLALDPSGRVIHAILDDPAPSHTRWAFTRDAHYEAFLSDAGWLRRTTLANGVGVWEAPVEVPPVGPVEQPAPGRWTKMLGWWWGVIPLATFASVGPAIWWSRRRAGEARSI